MLVRDTSTTDIDVAKLLGSLLLVDVKAIQDIAKDLGPTTQQRLAKKLLMLSNAMPPSKTPTTTTTQPETLAPSLSLETTKNNDNDRLAGYTVQLRADCDRRTTTRSGHQRRSYPIITRSEEFFKYYVPTLGLKIYHPETGRVLLEMTTKLTRQNQQNFDEENNGNLSLLVQTALEQLQQSNDDGPSRRMIPKSLELYTLPDIERFCGGNEFEMYYSNILTKILKQGCSSSIPKMKTNHSSTKLEIAGSFPYPLARLGWDHQRQYCNIHKLSLKLESPLSAPTMQLLSNWIRSGSSNNCFCPKEKMGLEALELCNTLSTASASSMEALDTFWNAIAESTTLASLYIDSQMFSTIMEQPQQQQQQGLRFVHAIRNNQSLKRFGTPRISVQNGNSTNDNMPMQLLQILVHEKPTMVKEFHLSWQDHDDSFLDTTVNQAIVTPLLESKTWENGGLSFLCTTPNMRFTVPAMDSLFQAIRTNKNLQSLTFAGYMSISKECMDNLWGALIQNTSLETLRFVSWNFTGSSVQLPPDWEMDFATRVLPHLSVTSLELPALKFGNKATANMFWNALTTIASNSSRIKQLEIPYMERTNGIKDDDDDDQLGSSWGEVALIHALSTISLEHLRIPNFQIHKNAMLQDKLVRAMSQNEYLTSFECHEFHHFRTHNDTNSPSQMLPDDNDGSIHEFAEYNHKKDIVQAFDRYLLYNRVGRRIGPYASIHPGICPLVLERINRLRFLNNETMWRPETEQIFKVEAIYEFLQGPLFEAMIRAQQE